MGNAKVKATTKASVKKVKAGSTHTKNTGGIMTAKVIAIVKKEKGK